MVNVYEYRQTGRSQVVILSAAVIAFVLTFGVINEASGIILMAWCLAGVLVGWMLIVNPVRGIQITQEHLVLNAWRKPRMVPLAEIAFLRAQHWTEDSDITIVYKDGTEESTNPRDMPSVQELAVALAERGVKVKDPGLTI